MAAGTYTDTVELEDTDGFDPDSSGDSKIFAAGLGLIVDDVLELTEVSLPACLPDDTSLCLADGRFRVQAEWGNFEGATGDGNAVLPTGLSGEFWFFSAENTELLVKVIDACKSEFNTFWVFAAGLTNVEVTLTVTDTLTNQQKIYTNPLGADFQPVLDTSAFATCQ